MNNSDAFQRTFLIFVSEDTGYEAGKKPSGHVRIEVREGRGRMHAAVQNLRESSGMRYAVYLVKAGANGAMVPAGVLKPGRNMAELEWEFNPRDVAASGYGIEDFGVIAVLAEYPGKVNTGIRCPLAAYRGKKAEWRSSAGEMLAGTGKKQEPGPEEGFLSKFEGMADSKYIPYETKPAFNKPEISGYGQVAGTMEHQKANVDSGDVKTGAEKKAADQMDAGTDYGSQNFDFGGPDMEHGQADAEYGIPGMDYGHTSMYYGKQGMDYSSPYTDAGTADESYDAEQGIEPAAEEEQPRYQQVQPEDQTQTGYQQAQTGYQQAQSGYQQAQPGYQQAQPGYQQAQPGYQQAQPGYQQAQPGYQQAQPDYQQAQPNYQQAQLNYQQAQPNYQQAQPNYQQAQPNYQQAQPGYQHTQAGYQQAQPDYQQAQPDYQEAQPNYQQAQPNYQVPGLNTNCLYLNSNMCGMYLSNTPNSNPCQNCHVHKQKGDAQSPRNVPGDVARLEMELDKYFEQSDPFHSKRSDYKWWKVTNPVNLNNMLYQCGIRSPLLFNPAIMMAHFKYRHLIIGIYSDRVGRKEYVVCGVPGMYMADRRPFGDMCRWVQAEGNRPKYGAFGYWLAYVDPLNGKILNLK